MSTLAVYPGSFDPLTNGHVDIIVRGARLFDRIVVAIAVNAEKAPLFTMDERVEIARAVFKEHPNVEVETFDGLLVDYVARRKADVIVRGLRAVSDFEFEFQMALMNRRLNAKIETVFMMPAEQYTYISSRLIKEVFALGGRVHGLVPDLVEARLRDKVSARHEAVSGLAGPVEDIDGETRGTHRSASPDPPPRPVTAIVDRLRRSGVQVIDFGAGEPDFPTVEVAKVAAHAAIDANFTKYTPNAGTADLKRAICDRYRTDYGVEYRESEVIVTAGGKQALYNTALALFGPGDEVITHAPYWPTHPRADQAGGRDAGRVADARRRRLRDPRERDPRHGHAANARHHHQLAVQSDRRADCRRRSSRPSRRSAARQGIWLDRRSLLREADLRSGRRTTCRAFSSRKCRDVGVICGSASKAYAMTGWRCGWTIGPEALIAASSALQSHATSNVSSITQKAVIAALTGSQEPVRAMLDEYRTRRDRLYEWLTADPRVKCHKPGGAFYMFVDISDVLTADRPRRPRPSSPRRCSRTRRWPSRRARRSARRASSGSRTRRRWTICARAAGACSSSCAQATTTRRIWLTRIIEYSG